MENQIPKIGTKEFNDLASACFGGKPKQQSAVEWYLENVKSIEIEYLDDKITTTELDVIIDNLGEQAKEMEKQQQDEFAIEFAKWCAELKVWDNETYVNNTFEELLEKFKNK